MNRTYQANISGRVFYIDENAFDLLNNYLDELRHSFSGAEGEEIVGDIETRISELFAERVREGHTVITIADVNRIIETMGSPAAISGSESDTEAQPDAPASGAADESTEAPEPPFITFNLRGRKKLFRNMSNKVFGGVVGGLGAYLGWNANIMRLLLVLLAVSTKIYPLVIIYLIAWMIIPPANTPRRVLEMEGSDINVDSVGQAVRAIAEPQNRGCVSSTFELIGKILMCFIGLLTGVMTIAFFAIFVGSLIAAITGSVLNASWLPMCIGGGDPTFNMPNYHLGYLVLPLTATMLVSLALSIVNALLTWGAGVVVFHFPSIKRNLLLTLIVIAAVLLAIAMILVFLIN